MRPVSTRRRRSTAAPHEARTARSARVTLEAVELRRLRLPLVTPFRTAFGVETTRDVLLVRAVVDGVDGWGECVAMSEPGYSEEYVAGAHAVTVDHLLPRLFSADVAHAGQVSPAVRGVKGHRMAKAAVEAAVLDAELRRDDRSLASWLGSTRSQVIAGVSIGFVDPLDALLETVVRHLDEGYRRIKLKIEPGRDLDPVRAVRERVGDEVLLQVDANASYSSSPADVDRLRALDPFDLLLIEQPLADDDIGGHAMLAGEIRTPICLDESIRSVAEATHAIEIGACSVVNVKPGRVGGLLEAKRIHDLCLEREVPVWCGGMLETGIGRAANVALAALPGFTLPGDLSASDRYFVDDLTEPFVLVDGGLTVPSGPGIGVEPRPDRLAACTTSVQTFRPTD